MQISPHKMAVAVAVPASLHVAGIIVFGVVGWPGRWEPRATLVSPSSRKRNGGRKEKERRWGGRKRQCDAIGIGVLVCVLFFLSFLKQGSLCLNTEQRGAAAVSGCHGHHLADGERRCHSARRERITPPPRSFDSSEDRIGVVHISHRSGNRNSQLRRQPGVGELRMR